MASAELKRKDLARQHLDSIEAWLRRLIDFELIPRFGPEYLTPGPSAPCPQIPNKIRSAIKSRFDSRPGRYPRAIDAAELGDSVGIVLKDELYREFFQQPLKLAFPDGASEARTFLERLQEIRNRLAHGSTCSDRDHKRCACYSNDLIESIKAYFKERNMEREFNVPTFIRALDNKGNEFHFSLKMDGQGQFVDVREKGRGDLYVGDELIIEVEVDPSFSGYTIDWTTFNGDLGNGKECRITINTRHVGLQMDVRFLVRSALTWHRLPGGIDDMLDLRYRVFPPVVSAGFEGEAAVGETR